MSYTPPPELHGLLMQHLEIESSQLKIQKASSDNLDWTWRVTYTNGDTGQSVAYTGETLQQVLGYFNRISFGRTRSLA